MPSSEVFSLFLDKACNCISILCKGYYIRIAKAGTSWRWNLVAANSAGELIPTTVDLTCEQRRTRVHFLDMESVQDGSSFTH